MVGAAAAEVVVVVIERLLVEIVAVAGTLVTSSKVPILAGLLMRRYTRTAMTTSKIA